MITLSIFTYKRTTSLINCLNSINSKYVNEILLFNDDEENDLTLDKLNIDNNLKNKINIYQPIDFNFTGRRFRKPFYMNKSVEIAKNDFIMFSDDDAIFDKKCINIHAKHLQKFNFCSGAIIKNKWIKKISSSILQGTNYSIHRDLFDKIGKYDEFFMETYGGGDFDFWYRIYQYTKKENISVAYLSKAIQIVHGKSVRVKNNKSLIRAREYTLKKHNLNLSGPMYKWMPIIRNKKNWMDTKD